MPRAHQGKERKSKEKREEKTKEKREEKKKEKDKMGGGSRASNWDWKMGRGVYTEKKLGCD